MFGPDLDIYSVQFQRWGKLRWLWLPYQKLLRHRSVFSHGLIIGTVVRVLYLGGCVLLVMMPVMALAQFAVGFDWHWQKSTLYALAVLKNKYPSEAIALFLGLELGAMSHSLSDWLASSYKRRKKKLQKSTSKPVRHRR